MIRTSIITLATTLLIAANPASAEEKLKGRVKTVTDSEVTVADMTFKLNSDTVIRYRNDDKKWVKTDITALTKERRVSVLYDENGTATKINLLKKKNK